ncbi:hypothetical protein J2Z23_000019 [Lederbergia galactosidilyticus]|uniref:hypothetical protein n=1 Tax=Lederbergia galactosidilytica TaxID=217031 RepID=UPI001AEA112B|nr:hypothetical protein [Lederbergia galactosidilytica]MBP1913087.1 hypothetical protein [Lederbergia galactosidilytica]
MYYEDEYFQGAETCRRRRRNPEVDFFECECQDVSPSWDYDPHCGCYSEDAEHCGNCYKKECRCGKNKDTMNNSDLKQFVFSEPLNRPVDNPIQIRRGEEEVLAKIEVCPKHDKHYCSKFRNLVWLAATVGWRGNFNNEDLTIEFRIRRGSRFGEIIFATRDGVGVDIGELRGQTTSFNHVDRGRKTCEYHDTEYFLTAELIRSEEANDRARIIGPIVFTGAVID